jgi:hypothetical protein
MWFKAEFPTACEEILNSVAVFETASDCPAPLAPKASSGS